MPRVLSNLNQMCDLPCIAGDMWQQKCPLYHTKIPPDVLPLRMFFNFTEGIMTSLYPKGLWVSKSFWHHVSVNTIISTSSIDLMNSGLRSSAQRLRSWDPEYSNSLYELNT